jgi:hypothetical protein
VRRIALVLLLLVAGAWLMYETRGTTLWFDEWIWALEYRDNSPDLAPAAWHVRVEPEDRVTVCGAAS